MVPQCLRLVQLLYGLTLVVLPIFQINDASGLPMYMRLLPKDRYGQFCSANAMVRAFAIIFFSILSGTFMDVLDTWWGMGPWRYRYAYVWTLAFQIPAAILLVSLYLQWKRRGGNEGYTPPA